MLASAAAALVRAGARAAVSAAAALVPALLVPALLGPALLVAAVSAPLRPNPAAPAWAAGLLVSRGVAGVVIARPIGSGIGVRAPRPIQPDGIAAIRIAGNESRPMRSVLICSVPVLGALAPSAPVLSAPGATVSPVAGIGIRTAAESATAAATGMAAVTWILVVTGGQAVRATLARTGAGAIPAAPAALPAAAAIRGCRMIPGPTADLS